MKVKTDSEMGNDKLFSGVLWLNAKAMGLALGLICALFIFIATNWLVLKGGNPVGPRAPCRSVRPGRIETM